MVPDTKTSIRKAVSQGKFTLNDYADGFSVSRVTATKHLRRLLDAGMVEFIGTADPDGRGRPPKQYKVKVG